MSPSSHERLVVRALCCARLCLLLAGSCALAEAGDPRPVPVKAGAKRVVMGGYSMPIPQGWTVRHTQTPIGPDRPEEAPPLIKDEPGYIRVEFVPGDASASTTPPCEIEIYVDPERGLLQIAPSASRADLDRIMAKMVPDEVANMERLVPTSVPATLKTGIGTFVGRKDPVARGDGRSEEYAARREKDRILVRITAITNDKGEAKAKVCQQVFAGLTYGERIDALPTPTPKP